MSNKLKGRPFRDDDIRTIVEEVTYLVQGGYRSNDRKQILDGLDTALDEVHVDTWKRWAGMQLRNVIDELYAIGA
jgi:hypothetical protein